MAKQRKYKTSHELAKEKGLKHFHCYDRPEIHADLASRSEEEGCSVADLIRRAIRHFLYGPTGRRPDEK